MSDAAVPEDTADHSTQRTLVDNLLEGQTDLEDEIQSLRDEIETYREHNIKPRFASINDELETATSQRRDLEEQMASLQSQVNRLEGKVESLMGVSEPSATNPEKRCQDVRNALMRRAEARSDDGAGRAAVSYQDVQDMLADAGHGEVKRPECYKAMKDAAGADGFTMTKKTSRHGNQVKAVSVNLADLAADSGCSNPTTRDTGSAATDTPNGGVQSNTD
jgi:cell division septum initiation protein DivIVA